MENQLDKKPGSNPPVDTGRHRPVGTSKKSPEKSQAKEGVPPSQPQKSPGNKSRPKGGNPPMWVRRPERTLVEKAKTRYTSLGLYAVRETHLIGAGSMSFIELALRDHPDTWLTLLEADRLLLILSNKERERLLITRAESRFGKVPEQLSSRERKEALLSQKEWNVLYPPPKKELEESKVNNDLSRDFPSLPTKPRSNPVGAEPRKENKKAKKVRKEVLQGDQVPLRSPVKGASSRGHSRQTSWVGEGERVIIPLSPWRIEEAKCTFDNRGTKSWAFDYIHEEWKGHGGPQAFTRAYRQITGETPVWPDHE